MANRHYGEIGDIWKHLPLAAILELEQPSFLWESHAGSAHYPLTRSPAREYGAITFMQRAALNPLPHGSAYKRLLDEYAAQDLYPGSPLLALRLVSGASFIFCDLDGESLHSIQASAKILGLPEDAVRTVQQDGISTLDKAAQQLTPGQASSTLVHIDPYHPLEANSSGLSSVDLFCTLSKRGAKVVLWYGYVSAPHRQQLSEGIREVLARSRVNYWRGEIVLDVLKDPSFEGKPGVLGCGLLCANLNGASLAACAALGEALVSLYAGARFPSGHSGALQFESETAGAG